MSAQRRYYSADGQKIFGTRRKAPYVILFLNFLVLLGMLLYFNKMNSGPKEVKITSAEGLELLFRRTDISREKTVLLSLELRNISGRTLRLEEDSALFRDATGAEQRITSGIGICLAPGDERVFRSVWPDSESKEYVAEIGFNGRKHVMTLAVTQSAREEK